jgi:hypothetical protein
MSGRSDVLREIDWQEICPWLILVRALRLALSARVLLLAVLGLLAATAGHRLLGSLFFDTSADSSEQAWNLDDAPWPWSVAGGTDTVGAGWKEPLLSATDPTRWREAGGLAMAWQQIVHPFAQLFEIAITWQVFFFTLFVAVWTIVVWAIVGGAITRIAALDLTRRELLGFRDAITQTTGRFLSFLAAPLLPLAAVAFLAIPLLIIGWCAHLSILAWLAGLFWFVVLAVGLALAALLILLAIGWPFMWATLSVERTDAFDAWSRAYAYSYQRPLRLLFYVIVAALLSALGMLVVQVVGRTAVWLGDWGVSWGAGISVIEALAGDGKVQFWKGLVATVVAAFPFAMLWTSAVAIYLLQREAIDGADRDDVVTDDQEESHGLPSLAPDASGVPEVTPTSTQEGGEGDDPPAPPTEPTATP